MATLDNLTNPSPIKAIIYKKTLVNDQVVYVPYLPRTNAEWVALSGAITVHGSSYSANTDLDTIVRALNTSIGTPGAAASSSTSDSLQAQINYISAELISKSGAFVYKGSLDPSQASGGIISPASNAKPGWVYNVSTPFNITSDGYIQYVASQANAQYGAGTNVVIIGSGTQSDPFKFDPLAGDMGNHALTSEAIGSAILDGNTITFKHVDNSNAGTITFSTISTTAVDTLNIVSTIPSTGADSSIPNVAAVRAFAGSADNVIVTTTSASANYYITFVSNTSSSGQPLYVNTGMTYNPATNVLNVTATQAIAATTAGTANQVANALGVFGISYNGSTAKSVAKGNGLTITISSDTTTVSVNAGSGITVDENGVAVNKGAGLIFNNGALAVNVNVSNTIRATGDGIGLTETGISGGTYSALQVDEYGRAKAGAQSIVFAENSSDPDLNSLVVGGLAFIGTEDTAPDSANTTHSIPEGTDPKIG